MGGSGSRGGSRAHTRSDDDDAGGRRARRQLGRGELGEAGPVDGEHADLVGLRSRRPQRVLSAGPSRASTAPTPAWAEDRECYRQGRALLWRQPSSWRWCPSRVFTAKSAFPLWVTSTQQVPVWPLPEAGPTAERVPSIAVLKLETDP